MFVDWSYWCIGSLISWAPSHAAFHYLNIDSGKEGGTLQYSSLLCASLSKNWYSLDLVSHSVNSTSGTPTPHPPFTAPAVHVCVNRYCMIAWDLWSTITRLWGWSLRTRVVIVNNKSCSYNANFQSEWSLLLNIQNSLQSKQGQFIRSVFTVVGYTLLSWMHDSTILISVAIFPNFCSS